MPRRKKKTKKRQRGGVRFSDIITVENRDRFIGQEIEIVSITNLIPRETDLTGGEFISELKTLRGFIEEPDQSDLHFFGDDGILVVNYPRYNTDFILHIPQNLRELSNDLGSDNPTYNYYVRLRSQRGPDLFTRNEMMTTMGENRRMNTFNPRIGTFHGYVPPTSMRDRMSDAVGYAPDSSRYLPRDVFDMISAPLRESVLNDRYLRRSRYPGSRFR